ncbi:TraB/GumN family protein [Enterobacter sp.]|uniref:TraB/GumN family protein n=1 Tax=Enterobacter sp. TaxID=42895 RepID=UPI00296F9915|nr:TraB/GumN family protein [Enterobacter sp.]
MSLFSRLKSSFRALWQPTYPWPALDVHLPGDRHLHLVGSIHMGTHDMSPLPARLISKLQQADALIVEADVSGNESPFSALPPRPPLAQRLTPEQLSALQKILSELTLSIEAFDDQPAWKIALVLQATQAQRLGLRPDYGIDYQLLQAAHVAQVPVIELEGTQNQIDLLSQLPDDGRALLEDTLMHWHTNARLLQIMIGWWMNKPPQAQEMTLPSTFSEPLYEVLMHQRNQAWCERLHALPQGRYVVAAGALHLYGEGNLPSLLAQKNGQ